MAVVLYHALLTAVSGHVGRLEHLFVLVLALSARLGVLAFIILSGYLLGRHWRGGFDTTGIWRQYRQFMLRRSLRILPPFYTALTLTVLAMAFLGLNHIGHTHWDTGLPFTWQRVVTNYTMVTDVLNQVPLSHQLWTVPLEYHLYLLAPFIVLGRSPRTVGLAGAAAVVALIILDPSFTAPFFVAAYVASFWAGLQRSTAPVLDVRKAARTATAGLIVTAAITPIAFFDKHLNVTARHYIVPEALFAILFLPWLYYRDVAGGNDLAMRIANLKVTRWLGGVSYSLYLIHGLTLELTWRALIAPTVHNHVGRVVAIMTLGTLLSIAGAALLHRLVERPTELASRRIRVEKPSASPLARV
jgi:peptidoglycan/LPS O-acetylase OafA/YrhL